MQILAPEDVKKGSSTAESELRARVRNLASEEERLVQSVNNLRQEEKDEQRKKAERESANQGALAIRKSVLEAEVDSLESRKKEALKPTRELEEKARVAFEENQAEAARLEARGREIEKMKDEAAAGIEANFDKSQELDERSEELDRREAGIAGAEKEVERSTNALRAKWVEYHTAVAAANERETDLAQREDRARVAEEANETRAAALDGRERDLEGRERLLRSNYQALEEAKKHLGIQ